MIKEDLKGRMVFNMDSNNLKNMLKVIKELNFNWETMKWEKKRNLKMTDNNKNIYDLAHDFYHQGKIEVYDVLLILCQKQHYNKEDIIEMIKELKEYQIKLSKERYDDK